MVTHIKGERGKRMINFNSEYEKQIKESDVRLVKELRMSLIPLTEKVATGTVIVERIRCGKRLLD